MTRSFRGLVVVALAVPASLLMGQQPRAWWPQEYTVERDDAAGRLSLATPYYTVEHDLKKGGAISRISLKHGRAENLLLEPVATTIRLLVPTPGGPAAGRRRQRVRDRFSDLHDSAPTVSHRRSADSETVTVEAKLLGEDGKESGVRVKTVYNYRWGSNEPAIEFVKLLRPLGDIERYKFEDWRNTAVRLEGDNCISVLYSRQGEAYILLANFNPEPKTVICNLEPQNLPYPLASVGTAEVMRGEKRVSLDAGKLIRGGERIEIGADDVVLLHVQ